MTPSTAAILVMAMSLRLFASEQPLAFGSIRFEENRGQTDARAQYVARTRSHQVFVTAKDVVFSPPAGNAIHMEFKGAGVAKWRPSGPALESISYYLGNDPAKWVKGAPVYDRLIWKEAYRGIDVVLYSRGDKIEYDLLLAAGADPSQVRLRFTGPGRLQCNAEGAIEIGPEGSALRQNAPEIYQDLPEGKRRKIAGRFVPAGAREFRLELASYERSKALVVDPVIEAASYSGGENDDEIVAATEGFVAGNTRSLMFPDAPVAVRRSRDIFVRGTGPVVPLFSNRSDFSGTVVLGGSDDDELTSIMNAGGSVFGVAFAGVTRSTDFPVTEGIGYRGGASDGFVGRLAVSQNFAWLVEGGYVGGSGEDRVHSIAGTTSAIALAGVTDSPDLRVPEGAPGLAGGKDAFFATGPFGSLPLHYAYLGGAGDDEANAVGIATNGAVWVGGATRSGNFPFAEGSLQGPSDAFLAEVKIDSFSRTLLSMTVHRIGGAGEDTIRALAARHSSITRDASNRTLFLPVIPEGVGFAGVSTSPDLPASHGDQPAFGGETDAFAGMWQPATGLSWLTYIGGSGGDEATAVVQNWAGDLYVGGWTRSSDLRQVDSLQPAHAGGEDGLLAVLDAAGSTRMLSYYGGSGDDRIRAITLVLNHVARLTGGTTSTDLPQPPSSRLRGDLRDGFIADVGSNHLLAPPKIILAKDGALNFLVRPGRTDFGLPVTYRSSDPARVRFVYRGRLADTITAPTEDSVTAVGLSDNGVVEITASASGYSDRIITAVLYPGAFVPGIPQVTLSTWASPSFLQATYRAIDPASGKPVGAPLFVHSDTPRQFRWSVSHPSVLALSGDSMSELRALRPGEARLTLEVEGFAVYDGVNRVVKADRPQLDPIKDIFLGQDLQTNLPIRFSLNGSFIPNVQRGTVTARSEDPTRLLVSAAFGAVGRESVTASVTGAFAESISVQALAGEGQVRVFLSSTEFEGEVPVTIHLEPSTIRWGQTRSLRGISTLHPDAVLLLETEATEVSLIAEGRSGVPGMLRPGIEEPVFVLSNSGPGVVEVNRLTVTPNSRPKLRGIALGEAVLSLAVKSGRLGVANPALPVRVEAWPATPLQLPQTVIAAKELQASVIFRPSRKGSVVISSEDPAAVLLATSPQEGGAGEITFAAAANVDIEHKFYVHALKSQGEVRLRVRPEGAPEQGIKVILAAPGVHFSSESAIQANGFARRTSLDTVAVDEATGVPLGVQPLRPGTSVEVRLRAEGSAIRLSRESLVLTSDSSTARFVDYTLPEPGQTAMIIAEPSSGFVTTRYAGRLLVRNMIPSNSGSQHVAGDRIEMAQDELREVEIPSPAPPEMTITSSDPSLILVSATATEPGAETVKLTRPASRVFLHGLSSSGRATVRFEAPGRATRELQVRLSSLYVWAPGADIAVGQTVDTYVFANAGGLRPAARPLRVSLRTANPAIATIQPENLEITGGYQTVQLTGLTAGSTMVQVGAPSHVDVSTAPGGIRVRASMQGAEPGRYSLGKNLQGGLQLPIGRALRSDNGVILNISSSDPQRVLLSRSAAAAGSASINVALQAGEQQTQEIYVHALEGSGQVVLRAAAGGVTEDVAVIDLKPSWFACTNGKAPEIVITKGSTASLSCSYQFVYEPISNEQPLYLSGIGLRTGMVPGRPRIVSTAPEVIRVDTPDGPPNATQAIVVLLHGLSAGVGEVRAEQPPGFGPAMNGSDSARVRVVLPRVSAGCGPEIVLTKDGQFPCRVSASDGAVVTAVSENPALLTVSPGESEDVILLQALAGAGTAEVVLSAPGHRDWRVAVRLRPTELNVVATRTPIMVGGEIDLVVRLDDRGFAAARPGSNITAAISATPAGVVTLEPAQITFPPNQGTVLVRVRGVSAGSAVIAVTGGGETKVSGTPVAVTVRR